MARKVFLLTVALCLAAALPVAAEPPGSGGAGVAAPRPNHISAVSVDERDEGTFIRVSGSSEPTYSVFTLNSPLRLFVDISNSRLGGSVRRAPISVRNGRVDQVAVLDFADEVQQVTRVIVSFDNKAAYDVRTDGNDVLIVVEGSKRPSDPNASVSAVQEELHQREADLDRARRALLEKERRLAEVERRVSDLEGQLEKSSTGSAEHDRLADTLQAERRAADSLRSDLQGREARLRELESSVGDLERRVASVKKERDLALSRASTLEEELSAQKAHVEQLSSQISKLQREHSTAQREAEQLKAQRDEARTRAEQLTKDRDAARKQSDELARRVEEGRKELSKVEKQRDDARNELASTRTESRAALEQADALRGEIATLRKELGSQDLAAEKTRQRLSALQSELEKKRASNDTERVKKLEEEKLALEKQRAQTERELQAATSKLQSKEQSLDESIARIRDLETRKQAAEQRASRVEAEHKDQVARIERVEKERSDALANSQRIEDDRLKALAEARKAEERRLAAVETSRKAEEERLEKVRETRLAQESALKDEEKKLEAARAQLARQEKAQADAEKRLADTRAAYEREAERVQLLKADTTNTSDKARKDLQQIEAARREREGEAAQARKELAAQKEELERLESVKREHEREVAQARKDLESQKKELETLRKAEEKRLAETRHQLEQEQAELERVQQERSKTSKSESAPAANELNTVRAIRFQEHEGVSRIVIEMDRPGDFATVPWREGRAALTLSGVSLPTALERSLDTRAFGGTVNFVNSYQDDKGVVHIEALVPGATTELVRQEGSKLYWEFTSLGAGEDTEVAASPGLPQPQGFTAQPPKYVPAATRAVNADDTPPWQRRPQGMARKRLALDIRGADVENVMRLMAKEGNVNIVTGGGVQGTVTMRLQNVPVADAFVTVLKSLDLGYEQEGEVIRVGTAKSFEEEAKRRQEQLVSSFKLDPLEVVLIPINYANADEVSSLTKQVLSNRGSATVDRRTNTLVIKDVARNIAAVQQLVLSLDAQTPQILIEARIVETNDRFIREIGVQWGGDFLFSPANGNPTGLAFPAVVGVAGAANDGQAPVSGLAGSPNFAVNLPAPIGTGSGGGFGVTLGSVGGAANLALRLSALEEDGHIKIVSSPKVLTLDNRRAIISQGTSIPISVVSAAGVQTVFVEARLQLEVEPHVTQDGNIQLALRISKSEPDFENTGARGDPTIIRKEAETQLLLGDGDTTVIGGIYSQTTGTSSSKVPFFGDIPILGFFFRDYSESETRTELLIFVTPRIVNREAALSARRLSPIQAPAVEQPRGAGGGQN